MTTADREVGTSRLLKATPAQVFDAWTSPSRLARWWGPEGFTNTFHECDPREGGAWRFTMHGPDGRAYPNESEWAEVEANRIVIEHLSLPRFQLVATFAEEGSQTRIRWRQIFETAEECEALRTLVTPANEQNLDRLEAELERAA